jgi:hypothetical protein
MQGPRTAMDTSFAQVFGRDLMEAREACRRYRINGEANELEKAWGIYHEVRIEQQMKHLYILIHTFSGFHEDRKAVTSINDVGSPTCFSCAVESSRSRPRCSWYAHLHSSLGSVEIDSLWRYLSERASCCPN